MLTGVYLSHARRLYSCGFVVCHAFFFCFSFVFISDLVSFFFFFSSRRRHTRYIGDWSSDVCSSDLPEHLRPRLDPLVEELLPLADEVGAHRRLGEERRPRLQALVQHGTPECGRIRRGGRGSLADEAGPGLGPLLELLLPDIEELVLAGVSHNSPSRRHGSAS